MPENSSPVIDTLSGPVRGTVFEADGHAITRFLAIPYADSPRGIARFGPPQPHPPWSEPRDATAYGPAAPQLESSLELMRDPNLTEFGDDCLSLNITTPAPGGGDGGRRPVLFWIHGGAFNTGSGANGLYRSGSLAASGDCVLVTCNYRLGVLGFLRLDEATDGAIPSSGTEGLQDQVAALKWVVDNIAAFGGDPDNITVFGESAGGMSVACLLAMPAARGLCRRAIIQSGGADIALPTERASAMGESFVQLLRQAGHDPADIASMPSEQLVEVGATLRHLQMEGRPAIMGMATVPALDGEHLPVMPIEAIRAGQIADIDLVVGWTRDEWNLFAAFDPQQWQMPEMRMYQLMDRLCGGAERARQLAAVYQGTLADRGRPDHPGAVFSQAMTDYAFRLPALEILDAQIRAGGRASGYCFSWESPLADRVLGACHALELPFLFGTLQPRSIRAWAGEGPQVQQLSTAIQRSWCQFARDGRAQVADQAWPLWDSESPMVADWGERQQLLPLGDVASLPLWRADSIK